MYFFSCIAQKTFPQKFLRQAKEECDFRRGKACLKTFLHLQNPTAQCGCGGGTMSIFSRSIGAGLRLKPFLSFNSHHRPGMPRLSYIFLFSVFQDSAPLKTWFMYSDGKLWDTIIVCSSYLLSYLQLNKSASSQSQLLPSSNSEQGRKETKFKSAWKKTGSAMS